MKRFTLLAAMAAFAFTSVTAQEQSVIVRKKKDAKEKVTVVIDGENITINGKDLKDYKGDDVEVVHGRPMRGVNGVRALTAPRAVHGMFEEMPMISADHFSYSFGGNKAMLGVNTEKVDNGVRITEVTKASDAEKAGLQKDDVITKVGDNKIEDADDLYEAVGKYKPEDKVDITYLRAGKENKLTATLGKNVSSTTWSQSIAPSVSGFGTTFLRRPRLGIQIQDTEDNSGVKILNVDEETPASKSGLKDGDVIYEINGKTIKSLDEIREETKDLKEGDSLKIKYKRDGNSASTEIKFPKRLNKANL